METYLLFHIRHLYHLMTHILSVCTRSFHSGRCFSPPLPQLASAGESKQTFGSATAFLVWLCVQIEKKRQNITKILQYYRFSSFTLARDQLRACVCAPATHCKVGHCMWPQSQWPWSRVCLRWPPNVRLANGRLPSATRVAVYRSVPADT